MCPSPSPSERWLAEQFDKTALVPDTDALSAMARFSAVVPRRSRFALPGYLLTGLGAMAGMATLCYYASNAAPDAAAVATVLEPAPPHAHDMTALSVAADLVQTTTEDWLDDDDALGLDLLHALETDEVEVLYARYSELE